MDTFLQAFRHRAGFTLNMTGAEVCVCVCARMCVCKKQRIHDLQRTGDEPLGGQTSRGGPKEDMGGTVEKKRKAGGGCVSVSVCSQHPLCNRARHRPRLKLIQSREDTQT